MKHILTRWLGGPAQALAAGGVVIMLAGCASAPPKEKPEHVRGWLGGEFQLAERPRFFGSSDAIAALPPGLDCAHGAGLLVKTLDTNTPAWHAGVRPGDLIIELAHHPVTELADAYEVIDRTEPGHSLPVRVWHAGTFTNYDVVVGREKFRHNGVFAVSLPPVFRSLDLWPRHGFSLVVLGYEPETIERHQLDSLANAYRRACQSKDEVQNTEWRAWAAIFQVWRSNTILAQETVPPASGAVPVVAVANQP